MQGWYFMKGGACLR